MYEEYPGHLHFATDAWTSPNHRAFVAWTVYLEYNGEMLCFLLDIIKVPEVSYLSHSSPVAGTDMFQSHTGTALAHSFQQMLEWFSLKGKILTFNGGNVILNDTQTTELDKMDMA
jgi:hypothetical protein